MDTNQLSPGSDGYPEKADAWMVLNSGKAFHFLTAKPEDISITDIAAALSRLTRYGGHTQFYSVAQHSYLVARMVSAPAKFTALLHDSTEAYLGDVIQPLKALLPEYRALERRLWQVIAQRFGLPPELPAEIKEADVRLMVTEKQSLFPATTPQWKAEAAGVLPYPGMRIHGLLPHTAHESFMIAYHSLAKLHAAYQVGTIQECDVCGQLAVEPETGACFAPGCLNRNGHEC